eukprot:TRINITY_DN35547_c0_g1_i1.p1 TRINITY_DN35547_c0_g1~~TRINITY_DN35547_c0_g1_i1.p1  ORF type:complete len:479 (+),score=9.98 TRINITY_DN35547_c0_g1_i1:269-1705(+)
MRMLAGELVAKKDKVMVAGKRQPGRKRWSCPSEFGCDPLPGSEKGAISCSDFLQLLATLACTLLLLGSFLLLRRLQPCPHASSEESLRVQRGLFLQLCTPNRDISLSEEALENATSRIVLWSGKRPIGKSKDHASAFIVIVVYEIYDDPKGWDSLHSGAPYRGLSLASSSVNTDKGDIDSTALMPLLEDVKYQLVLGEHGAIFAVFAKLDRVHGPLPWIGFQGWRAVEEGMGISEEAANMLQAWLGKCEKRATPLVASDRRIAFFWTRIPFSDNVRSMDLYNECDFRHGTKEDPNRCSAVLATVFWHIFESNKTIGSPIGFPNVPALHILDSEFGAFLPPMPGTACQWSSFSSFAMHRDALGAYVKFARMVFTTLEALWGLHDDFNRCPLGFKLGIGKKHHCWSLILDRVLNIWVYHSGMRVAILDDASDGIVELHPVEDRRMWMHWFGSENIEVVYQSFPGRCTADSLTLFYDLSPL